MAWACRGRKTGHGPLQEKTIAECTGRRRPEMEWVWRYRETLHWRHQGEATTGFAGIRRSEEA